MTEKLKKVYEDALRIYQEKQPITANYEVHLSRLFRYAINLKRMDFISKQCLNPLFREALILNGYEKSQDFMQEVKNDFRDNKLSFNEGRVIFQEN